MNPSSVSDTIVEEISIQAPAERIFEALTDPVQRIEWWGRQGRFQVARMESDLRPGGRWMMSGMGMGKPFQVSGEYRQIQRPRLLVFTWLPDWQGDATESVVRFDPEESGGITRVRLTHSGLATGASQTSHRGWPQILAALQAYSEQRA